MEGRESQDIPIDRSRRVGYVVCRGVGVPVECESGAHSPEVRSVRAQIEAIMGVAPASEDVREIAWNAQRFMPARGTDHWQRSASGIVPALGPTYLRRLGAAWRECIRTCWPHPRSIPAPLRPFYRLFLLCAGLLELATPCFFAGVSLLLMGMLSTLVFGAGSPQPWPAGFWTKGVAWAFGAWIGGGLLVPLCSLVFLRKPVFWSALRSGLLAVLWPLFALLFGAFAVPLPEWLWRAVLWTAVGWVSVQVYSWGYHWMRGPYIVFGELVSIIPGIIVLGLVWLAAVIVSEIIRALATPIRAFGDLLFHGLAHGPVWPLAKIFADVLLYIGDQEYHRLLISYAVGTIGEQRQAGYREVRLLGHSLGSVILADALTTIADAPSAATTSQPGGLEKQVGSQRLVLITGGSPLRRWITRFFPGTRLQPAVLEGKFRSLWPGFRWINLYRKRDPVGTRLNICEERCIEEGNGLSLRKAHLDYWGDHAAREAILNALGGTCPTAPPRRATALRPPAARLLWHPWADLTAPIVALALLLPLGFSLIQGVFQAETLASYRQQLLNQQAASIPARLWLVCEQKNYPKTPITYWSEDFYVRYRPPGKWFHRHVAWDSGDLAAHDMNALLQALYAAWPQENAMPRWGTDLKAYALDVTLRVNSAAPRAFDVPRFARPEPKRYVPNGKPDPRQEMAPFIMILILMLGMCFAILLGAIRWLLNPFLLKTNDGSSLRS